MVESCIISAQSGLFRVKEVFYGAKGVSETVSQGCASGRCRRCGLEFGALKRQIRAGGAHIGAGLDTRRRPLHRGLGISVVCGD